MRSMRKPSTLEDRGKLARTRVGARAKLHADVTQVLALKLPEPFLLFPPDHVLEPLFAQPAVHFGGATVLLRRDRSLALIGLGGCNGGGQAA